MNSTISTACNSLDDFIQLLARAAEKDPLVLDMIIEFLNIADKLDKQEETELVEQCVPLKGRYADIIALIRSHPKY